MKNKKTFYPVEWRKKISGIYQIKNKINNKIYVGSSINIYRRWKEHIRYLNDNTHHNIHLLRAWKKYGKENFEFSIIEELLPMQNESKKVFTERIIEKEQYYIDKFNCSNSYIGYNISGTASGGDAQKITFDNFDEKEKIFTKEQFIYLVFLLITTDYTLKKIAQITQLNYHIVYNIYNRKTCKDLTKGLTFLKRKDTSNISVIENNYVNYIEQMFKDGKSYNEMSKELNLPLNSIKKYCKNNELFTLKTYRPIYIYDLFGNFLGQYRNPIEASRALEVKPCNISNQLNGEREYINQKYWASYAKGFKEMNIFEQIMGQLLTKKMNPIVEQNKINDIIIYLSRECISKDKLPNAIYNLSNHNPNIFCKNGSKFNYLLELIKKIYKKY